MKNTTNKSCKIVFTTDRALNAWPQEKRPDNQFCTKLRKKNLPHSWREVRTYERRSFQLFTNNLSIFAAYSYPFCVKEPSAVSQWTLQPSLLSAYRQRGYRRKIEQWDFTRRCFCTSGLKKNSISWIINTRKLNIVCQCFCSLCRILFYWH